MQLCSTVLVCSSELERVYCMFIVTSEILLHAHVYPNKRVLPYRYTHHNVIELQVKIIVICHIYCLAPEGKRDIGGGLSVCPFVVCRPPGKSFRLKFLMYVWNTFRGHIKLQKDFRWTVWRSNIDIIIHADENQIILMIFLLFGLCHFLAPLCHLAAELFKCRLVRRRRRRRRRRRQL